MSLWNPSHAGPHSSTDTQLAGESSSVSHVDRGLHRACKSTDTQLSHAEVKQALWFLLSEVSAQSVTQEMVIQQHFTQREDISLV